jgi:carboxymethylenebutenolidase
MIETHIEIETEAGVMNTFVVHPESGPAPVVLFYMDAPGKREELHDMARRLATVGYYVMLPNLYYRKARDFEMKWTDAGRQEMFALASHLRGDMVMQDTEAMLDYARLDDAADDKKIGAVGYCMSGPHAFRALATFSDQLQCAASIYGANLLTESQHSPHLLASQIKGEMYFACAEIDEFAPRSVIDELDTCLEDSGINYAIEWYPGAHHGFAFPQRGADIYDRSSAERHWEQLFALFERNLKKV